METKDYRATADAADITPQTLDGGVPPMGELIDGLFAGFAPAAGPDYGRILGRFLAGFAPEGENVGEGRP